MHPTKEEIIKYGKKRIIELYAIDANWAEILAEQLLAITWSTGGDIKELENLDSGIKIIVKGWIEDSYLKDKKRDILK